MAFGVVNAPGRVNLIGEHIDYHGFPVLPMAIGQSIRLTWRARNDARIHAVSSYGVRDFEYNPELAPVASGDWENYIRAAARLVNPEVGIDAEVTSDLPAAAGLSSSSALLIAFTLALHRANGRDPGFDELMEVLPDGEQFVGTRGGGMDHAAILGSKAGYASLVRFNPVTLRHVPIPRDWKFLVADSGVRAEKSGSVREQYNARRMAGTRALAGKIETVEEHDAYEHVTSEAQRVTDAVCAMERGDASTFGRLLLDSHASLRDRLKVSCPALDRLVDAAMDYGALGARLTGAGFGGCIVIFAKESERLKEKLGAIDAVPSDGVLA